MVRKTLKFGVLSKARKYVLYSGKYITILMLHTHFFDLFFFFFLFLTLNLQRLSVDTGHLSFNDFQKINTDAKSEINVIL